MTYEWPVGIAWKELDLFDDKEQTVRFRIEADLNEDGAADWQSEWISAQCGVSRHAVPTKLAAGSYRIVVSLSTETPSESPLIRRIKLELRNNS